jgi:hypothetical protein
MLAAVFLLLAAVTASGKVWRQESAQQQQPQQQQPATTPADAQQPSAQPSTPAADAQQQPAATPAEGQQPAATTDGQQPAATPDGQQPAATPDAQAPAQAGDAQKPVDGTEGAQAPATAETKPTTAAKKDDKKKGKSGGIFGKKSGPEKQKDEVYKIDPLGGIKDLDGESLKEAGPFTEADADTDTKSSKNKSSLEVNEEELKRLLFKKELYLRNGYLNDNLNFNEHGGLIGKSPTGPFTLNYIEVTHITMGKHKITLECNRYGLHFMGNLTDDPDKDVQMIKLTPPKKKKPLTITIDREVVVKVPKPKSVKVAPGKPAPANAISKKTPPKKNAGAAPPPNGQAPPTAGTEAPATAQGANGEAPANGEAQPPATGEAAANGEQKPAEGEAKPAENAEAKPAEGEAKPADATAKPEEKVAKAPTDAELEQMTPDEQVKASIAATKPEERPADPNSVTHTFSPVHSSRVLRRALDQVFAVGQDSRMLNAMPDFWKHYYEAQDSRSFYRFKVPGMVRINEVDTRPQLLKAIEPGSNQYAQDNAIVGIARYRALVGADGKVQDVAITVPIGFGLDERAVDSIKKAEFKPATKGGQPVMTSIDLYITFRIFSKMTSATSQKKEGEAADKNENNVQVTPPTRPGPFTLMHPYSKDSTQQELSPQAAPQTAPTGTVQPATGQKPADSDTPKN